MKPIAILNTGNTIPAIAAERGDFTDWFQTGLDHPVIILKAQSEALPQSWDYTGIVITGSAAMVSHRLDWSEKAGLWLLEAIAKNLPILGVCYGHQLLAQALGGIVGPNPNGREIGTKRIALTDQAADDLLMQNLQTPFYAQTTHEESVLKLPPDAQVLAVTEQDQHHAMRFAENVWGVQFHPEFDADIMRAYLQARRERLEHEGLDVELLLNEAKETPQAWGLLRRFAQLCSK